MSIWKFLTGLVEPVTKLVDELHTSDEERLQIKAEITRIQTEMSVKLLEYEKQLLASKTQVITAEANGQSWLQRSWRPITMLIFVALVVLDGLGLLENPMPSDVWSVIKLGLGGYLGGRTVEKVVTQVTQGRKNKEAP